MSTSIVDVLVPKLRRAIGDNNEPYAYADSILAEYMADSIEGIQIMYQHDYEVDRDLLEVTPDVDIIDQHLFVLYANILMVENQSNISFSVGGLSVRRNSGLSNKEDLKEKLKTAIGKKRMYESIGVSSTEYDTYKNRLEYWLKYITY